MIPPDERAAAPDFAGSLLDGGDFSSTELDGDVAVLNFWGSWCAPCRVETPEFQEVYADVRDDGVQFLGLNVKEPSEQFALAFVERFGIEFPSLYDPRGEVALAFRDYPANAIPSTIVLDREGRVAAVYTGESRRTDLRARDRRDPRRRADVGETFAGARHRRPAARGRRASRRWSG